MKLLVPLILLFSQCCIAQENSLKIERSDICPNLFEKTQKDSTYINFYVREESDTMYFNNLTCVQNHLITDPYGTTLWRTFEGLAEGFYEYNYRVDSSQIRLLGKFTKGFLKSGFKEIYRLNGTLESRGVLTNGRKEGLWSYYEKNGELDYRVMFTDNIGTKLEN